MFSIKQFGDLTFDIPHIRAHPTPIGQITTSVRRIQDLYYCRVNDMILPNIAKLADGLAYGDAIPANKVSGKKMGPLKYKRRLPSSHGLGTSMWVVPNDNASSMFFGWHHLGADEDQETREHRIRQVVHGQLCDRPYEERQRNPGDFDVLVSQGPNVSRDNDNLTPADVGIALYRKQLREGIRAVQTGKVPKGLVRSDAVIPTYAHALVRPAPALGSDEEERERKAAVELDVTEQVLAHRVPNIPSALEPM
jgi:hypothetical protein